MLSLNWVNMEVGQKLYSVVFFLLTAAAGAVSLLLLQTEISLQTLIQIISALIIIIIASTRILLPKIQRQFGNQVALLIEGIPILIFVYILVLATGGVSSPFLGLTHFMALAVAFLLAPQLAVEFIFATIFLFAFHIYFDITAQKLFAENIFSVILYFIAYLALVPISYAVAKEYKVKEEWVEKLSEQIATSKTQEETLLTNIADAVLILNKNLDISFINRAFITLTKYNLAEIGQKNFFQTFKFKDPDGGDLESFNLPIQEVFTTKNQVEIQHIQITNKSGDFLRVGLKILPLISQKGQILGALLIFKSPEKKDMKRAKPEKALRNLSGFLENSKNDLLNILPKVEKNTPEAAQKIKAVAFLQDQAAEFILDIALLLKIEAGIMEGLSSFVNVSQKLEELVNYYQKAATGLGVKISFSPQQKGPALTLANEEILTYAFKKLIKAAILVSEEAKIVKVGEFEENDLIKIKLHISNISYRNDQSPNEFVNTQLLLARKIFEIYGGSLKTERAEKKLLLLANLIRQTPES